MSNFNETNQTISNFSKEEKNQLFKKLFYQKYGTYQNYLKQKKKKPKKKKVKSNFSYKVIFNMFCLKCLMYKAKKIKIKKNEN